MTLTDILEIPAGKIEGVQQKTQTGTDYYAFYGIPYAEPPVNTLRFCRPKRLNPWPGVLAAKNKMSFFYYFHKIAYQEDCLYLNIYTPSLKQNVSLPIMFFIHGGAFQAGDGGPEIHGPDYFMNENVVLVTINYRIGPFGFLTLRSDVAPGNLGLWDQKMALEWVRDNIAKLGGNSRNITIFGESAGAMSCMMHMVSQQSKGLFHKIIAQSGTFWNAYEASFLKKNSGKLLAAELGFDVDNRTDGEILEFLQQAPLIKVNYYFLKSIAVQFKPFLFVPCIDDFSSDPFLPEDGLTLLEKGHFNKVPIIQGVNRNEGLVFLPDAQKSIAYLNENWLKWTFQFLFDYEEDFENSDMINIIHKLETLYLNNQKIGEKNIQNCVELAADKWFNSQLHLSSLFISKNSQQPLFRYVFDHEGKYSPCGIVFMSPLKSISKLILKRCFNIDVFNERRPGVNHADELIYLFNNNFNMSCNDCASDTAVRDNIIKLWTSFASSGYPTHSNLEQWRQYSREKPYEYFSIAEKCKMKVSDDDYVKRIEFWIRHILKKNIAP